MNHSSVKPQTVMNNNITSTTIRNTPVKHEKVMVNNINSGSYCYGW
jgi:hypothetical protein